MDYKVLEPIAFDSDSQNYNGYSDTEVGILLATCYLNISCYLALLVWCILNYKWYVIDQGRSKSYSLVVFYVLAMLICLVRILMYFAGVILFSQWFLNNYVAGHSFLYNIGYVVAIYLAIVLGLYQNSSMIELSIRIRYPLNSG